MLSLAVLLVPIVAIVALFQVIGGDREVTVVDPAPSIAEARRAGLPVLSPRGLPGDWKPTSAVVRTAGGSTTLRIGYVSPSGGFVQLVQSDADAAVLLRRELGDGRPTGTEQIRGTPWHAYPGRAGERALVRTEPTRTVLVLGTAPAAELRTLAASLR